MDKVQAHIFWDSWYNDYDKISDIYYIVEGRQDIWYIYYIVEGKDTFPFKIENCCKYLFIIKLLLFCISFDTDFHSLFDFMITI